MYATASYTEKEYLKPRVRYYGYINFVYSTILTRSVTNDLPNLLLFSLVLLLLLSPVQQAGPRSFLLHGSLSFYSGYAYEGQGREGNSG